MRAIVVHELGDPEVLVLRDIPAPRPGPGELLVALQASGVNFADTERRRGIYATPTLPWVPGHEAAGIVRSVGDGVDGVRVGEHVAFWTPRSTGTYAEEATVAANDVFRFPREFPFEHMAALPLNGLTAYGVVHLVADIRAGQVVVIHAAAGGVGQIAVQLALRLGARVLGTASSAAKLAAIRALGAEALAYGDDLADRVLSLTQGHGADVVLDSVGAATQPASLRMLAEYGQLVFYGEASGRPASIHPDALYDRSLRVGAFGLNIDDVSRWSPVRAELARALESGELRLTVGDAKPLGQAPAVHRLLESRATIGKQVLDPTR